MQMQQPGTPPPPIEPQNQPEARPSSGSHWPGVIFIFLFFLLDGASYCPWYIWLVFASLAILTIVGSNWAVQVVLGLVVLFAGTGVLDEEADAADSTPHAQTSAPASAPASPYADIKGNWELVIPSGSSATKMRVSINADGTGYFKLSMREGGSSWQAVISTPVTFRREGNHLYMRMPDSSSDAHMTVSGGRLVSDNGQPFSKV